MSEPDPWAALARSGGVLLYGIPEFRLPNAIVDSEVQALRRLGVKFVMNTIIGRAMTLEELRQEYDAVFLGTGAGLPRMLGVPGEDLDTLGILSTWVDGVPVYDTTTAD